MATKKTQDQTAEPSAEVTISRTSLAQLVSVINDMEKADAAYQNCQASIFRNYASGLYKANNTRKAMAEAQALLAE